MTVRGHRLTIVVALFTLASALPIAQTKITPPKNRYTPEQDVEIGREAAQEVRKEYPVIADSALATYLDRLGKRLVAAAPPELNNPVFEYSFTPVNLKDINAFALPGGPMFVNRGMFEAASGEGEVVGVMAHELSHVLLRHGTANATKAQGFQFGQLAGAIAGAVVGGGWGQVISEGSSFGLGTWLLKYSREYEKQADLLGVQIMARAGYDPRDLGRMFETIQKKGGNGAPQWLSSHPDPGNRSAYIAKEASTLQIARSESRPADFQQARTAFNALPPAKTMAELARKGGPSNTGSGREEPAPSVGRVGDPVPPPSTQYRTVQGGRLFQVEVPSNWQAISSNNAVKYVPPNGYGATQGGGTVFTHGVELGVARASSRSLAEATNTLLSAFAQNNPELRRSGEPREIRMAQRAGLAVPLVNRSELGGTERIGIYTTFLADGNLFYYATIVPDREADQYRPVFDRIGRSISLKDAR
ncbi:MAG TPA: M48 family metallopeptidase [Vicinamibacterales bacterium]|nr:M48 family metallopeptidase [Vicinamibacterales bacterium]